MADEAVQQADPAAAQVSSPLSSQQPAPSASPTTPAPAAASAQTPASPATTETTTQTEQKPARPEGIPDKYWDATANALKVDPATLAADLKERDELQAFKAADEVRRNSLPQSAEGYKIELPADFQLPAGMTFELDVKDPLYAAAQKMAHAKGWSQQDFSEGIGLIASMKVAEQAQIDMARKAEVEKLGTTGPQRIDAVVRFFSGVDTTPDKSDAKAIASMLVTAKQVEAFERLITRFGSQGVTGFSQKHRDMSTSREIEGWDKMSFEQRRAAQDNAARRAHS